MRIHKADTRPEILQDFQAHGHVGYLGNIFNAADPVHQKGGGNDSNGGVFGAADLDFSKQGLSALYYIFRQNIEPLFKFLAAANDLWTQSAPSGGALSQRQIGGAREIFDPPTPVHGQHTISFGEMQTFPAARTAKSGKMSKMYQYQPETTAPVTQFT
jgi:hypothetical protein